MNLCGLKGLAALLLWSSACAAEEHCAPGEVCADEDAQAMETSMLQRTKLRGEDTQAQLERLRSRKTELLNELVEIEKEVEEEGLSYGSGNCATYGCNYVRGRNCQCNDKCKKYGSCCPDFESVCAPTFNCSTFGCNYERGRICQCNAECGQYDSCCADYRPVCAPPTAEPTPEPTPAPPTPEPTPAPPTSPPTPPTPAPPTPPPTVPVCAAELPDQPATCQEACSWAKTDGIYGHPQWYVGLTNESTCEEFALKLAQDHQGGCILPPTPAPPTPPPPPPTPPPKSGELPYGHPTPGKVYPKYPGYELWLVEEFDEPLDLDADPIWTWSDGGLREGDVRFVKEQVTFEGGVMKIEARKATSGGPKTQSCSKASVEKIPHKPLFSGELRSRHNIFRYGRYEVKMKAPEVHPGDPNANGNFISTMFFYRDANAHHWREIDFEIEARAPNALTTNLLYADGTKNWAPWLADSKKPYLGHINTRSDFHVYAFDWTPKGVIWYVDDKVVRKGTRLKTPELSGKVMMNLWIFHNGGFGGNDVWNNRYPMHAEYDWFRFYRWNGETTYPCKEFSTSCLVKDDMYLSGNNPCDGIPVEGKLMGQWPCKPYTPSDCPANSFAKK